MKSKTMHSAARGARAKRAKTSAMRKHKKVDLPRCRHCGGALRFLPDEISCLACGRPADHVCETCMFKEPAVVMG